MIINEIKIYSSTERFLLNDSSRTIDLQSIKKVSVAHINAQFNQAVIECKGVIVYASRELTKTFRSMMNSIHPSHHSQKDLCGTDVGCRTISFNMLLTSLQCHSQGTISLLVLRNANNTTRNTSFILCFGCKITSMWTAITHRDTKALGTSNNHICTISPGRFKKC